jgi:two-component system LytT family sensor kinase
VKSHARARYAWLILATCGLLTLLQSAHTALVAQVHGERVDLPAVVLRHLPLWSALGGLIPLIGYGARRLRLYGPTPWRALAAHLAAGALFPFAHHGAAAGVRLLMTGVADSEMSSGAFVFDVLLYWVVLGAHTVYALHRRHTRDVAEAAALRLAAERLEGSLMDANLQALRWQLNPHFLFNALNSLSILADEARAPRVVEVIGRLSALLRIALEQHDQTTTLQQETVFLCRYLDFERVRFEERLGVAWDLEPECLGAQVPALVLQPLVENAIKHGVDRASGSASLVIGAARAGGKLRLWVTDSGPGLSARPAEHEGIGLRNTRNRLEQLFGDNYALRLEPASGSGVTATIVIPWLTNGAHTLEESAR